MSTLLLVCIFTALLHFSETLAYVLRLAGLRVKQLAIAMSFVTSTLLISRLSNMFQAPLLGKMVDMTVMEGTQAAVQALEVAFRWVIFAGSVGVLVGMLLTPSALGLFEKVILKFKNNISLPKLMLLSLHPKNTLKIIKSIKVPTFKDFKDIVWAPLPKKFLLLNVIVAAVYTIGVICALLAGAYLPELRATAIQLSGLVNGIGTILMTLMVDPPGARVTDEAYHGQRPESHVKSVVFFMQLGRLLGILIVSQLLLKPFTAWVMFVTRVISG